MTHDELLAKLNKDSLTFGEISSAFSALRAVVELANKYEDFDGVDSAAMRGYRVAMKSVIQAIEKELER